MKQALKWNKHKFQLYPDLLAFYQYNFKSFKNDL